MIQLVTLIFATLWTLLLPCVVSQEVAAANSSICQTCSTTAVFWVLSKPVETDYEIDTVTVETRNITKGTKTETRLDLTTTKWVKTTDIGEGPDLRNTVFNRRTTTVRKSSVITTTICAPTSTPSDYPASTVAYCDCKKTASTTITTTDYAYLYGVTTTYLTTQHVQPTIYGYTVIGEDDVFIEAPVLISNVKFTKTIYQSTKTVTHATKPTSTDSQTFKLQIVNCPNCYPEPGYVTVPTINDNYGPTVLDINADKSLASVFEIVNGMLHLRDPTDPRNVTCGFSSDDYDYDSEGSIMLCGTKPEDVATLLSGHLTLDCFGHLRGYVGDSAAWGYSTNGYSRLGYGLVLVPGGDPVHGQESPGDAFFYFNVRVIPYSQ